MSDDYTARALIQMATGAGKTFAAVTQSDRLLHYAGAHRALLSHDELVARDKANLDLIWLKDDSLEHADSLPPPKVTAREIVEDLEIALGEFAAIAEAPESRHRVAAADELAR